MGNTEKKLDRSKTLREIKASEDRSIAQLGQYVPVHNYVKNNTKTATSPIANESPKFSIYDCDYLGRETLSEQDLYGNFKGNFLKFFKYLFLNLPVINFLFLKIKQSKIQKSLSSLDYINDDVDKLVNFFEGKSVTNEKKYQKICEELIRANNIQTQIKKEILKEV